MKIKFNSDSLSKEAKQLVFAVANRWFKGDQGRAYLALVECNKI